MNNEQMKLPPGVTKKEWYDDMEEEARQFLIKAAMKAETGYDLTPKSWVRKNFLGRGI